MQFHPKIWIQNPFLGLTTNYNSHNARVVVKVNQDKIIYDSYLHSFNKFIGYSLIYNKTTEENLNGF